MGFPNIGPGELILILIIALVVLGPGKLPDVASSLGKSVREFRKAATDVSDAGKLDATPPAQSLPPTAASAPVPHIPAAAVTPEPESNAGTDAPAPAAAHADRLPESRSGTGGPSRDPNVS